jgi:hypothetical protein
MDVSSLGRLCGLPWRLPGKGQHLPQQVHWLGQVDGDQGPNDVAIRLNLARWPGGQVPGLHIPLSHKVLIYIEYHIVCPLVGIEALPPPLSHASVPLPPGSSNSDDWRKSLALCLL